MEEKYGTEGNLMSRDLVAREIAMCPGQVYLETAKESIPVTPAIHFFMGGIKVDGMHQTNIAGLYAVDVYKRQPHRLVKTLKLLSERLGDRKVTVCRELTKRHETAFQSTLEGAVAYYEANEMCIRDRYFLY